MNRITASNTFLCLLAGLALGLGYRVAPLAAFADRQDALHYLTDPQRSVREIAAVVDRDGNSWASFLSFSDTPEQVVASLQVIYIDADAKRVEVNVAQAESFGAVTCTALSAGGVYLVWETAAENTQDFQLVGCALHAVANASGATQIQPGAVEQIPTGKNSALMPQVVQLANRELALTWQALDGPFYRIFFATRKAAGDWSQARAVTPAQRADCWRPRLGSTADGRVLVAYDRYAPETTAGYDVYLASAAHPDAEFQQQVIAGGPTYQGFPELGIDHLGRAWVTYEEAPSFGQGGPLRSFRNTRLVCVQADGQLFHAVLPESFDRSGRGDLPRLVVGAMGLAISRRIPQMDYQPRNRSMVTFYPLWHTSILSFDQDGEAYERIFDSSDGDNENDSAMVINGNALKVFFTSDQRSKSFAQRFAFHSLLENHWRLVSADLAAPRGFPTLFAGPAPTLPQSWQTPRLQGLDPQHRSPDSLVGDLHRHTDLSRCAGFKDGILLDAVRYARGPGCLDFMAITDHFQHLSPWSHWIQMRDIERFDAPGSLALLPGTERMLTDLGHQNVIFGSFSKARAAGRDQQPTKLEIGSFVAIPHMSSLPRNSFDWQRLDPQMQRLIEVHQGFRGSFEGPALNQIPLISDSASNSKIQDTWPMSAYPAGASEGWLAHLPSALKATDIPPGLVSSSDHASTGTAFAGVFVAAGSPRKISRQAIFEAILSRQSFATTGPAHSGLRPQEVRIMIDSDRNGNSLLKLAAPAKDLASITIFENGKKWFVKQGDDSASNPMHFLISTHFGKDSAWELQLHGQEMRLGEGRLRQPRPELMDPIFTGGAAGAIRLSYPENVSYGADLDLIVPVQASSAASRLGIDLQRQGGKAQQHHVDFQWQALEADFAQRLWLGKVGQKPYLEIMALGAALVPETQHQAPQAAAERQDFHLVLPLSEAPEAAIYYARLTWLDGNMAWSRLVRRP